jgi:hypothetical protein
MAGRGRPTKFDAALAKKVIDALQFGCYVETAAAYAGISKNTFYRWMRAGERASRGALHEWKREVDKALVNSELVALGRVRKAMEHNWQAAAWYLERRKPHEWGRRRVEVTGADGKAIEQHQAVRIYLPDNGRAGNGTE